MTFPEPLGILRCSYFAHYANATSLPASQCALCIYLQHMTHIDKDDWQSE